MAAIKVSYVCLVEQVKRAQFDFKCKCILDSLGITLIVVVPLGRMFVFLLCFSFDTGSYSQLTES